MDKREEQNRNKNRIIVILLFLVVILAVYAFLVGPFLANEDDLMQNEYEEVIPDPSGETEESSTTSTKNEDSIKSNKEKGQKDQESLDQEEFLLVDSASIKDEVGHKDAMNSERNSRKFGLSFSQRNEIWRTYQKRQGELQEEAKELNSDKFSAAYTRHVDKGIKKLRASLTKKYNISKGDLDYVLQEGKNGKFNDAVQRF